MVQRYKKGDPEPGWADAFSPGFFIAIAVIFGVFGAFILGSR